MVSDPSTLGSEVGQRTLARASPGSSTVSDGYADARWFGAVDPFESYPPTRLSRTHVQRLMHGFLHKIAFQYYPLDLNAHSNPFLVSWWPLALGDPALFHVSLQAACLDEELLAQKGFQTSNLLMADSVSLLRRKVEDTSLAAQDSTMNSVITLATIEFGKGSLEISRMHINGVKRLVDLRGGINVVRQTSPLTARMVCWVSMIVTGRPQFPTQDDHGTGLGIPTPPEWHSDVTVEDHDLDDVEINRIDIKNSIWKIFLCLRRIFKQAKQRPLSPTQLHDLVSFTIHRLLAPPADAFMSLSSPMTDCMRYAMALHMFIIQGPTYYSHAIIMDTVLTQLVEDLERLERHSDEHNSLKLWCYWTGLASSTDDFRRLWFSKRTEDEGKILGLHSEDEIADRMKRVLWLETRNERIQREAEGPSYIQ